MINKDRLFYGQVIIIALGVLYSLVSGHVQVLLNGLPVLSTTYLTWCYFPQLKQTYLTKKVEGINLDFWRYLNIALTLMLINATVTFFMFGAWGYMILEIINEGMAFAMLIMVEKYKKN
jgi:uncharacterized protein with PQ loop repeat